MAKSKSKGSGVEDTTAVEVAAEGGAEEAAIVEAREEHAEKSATVAELRTALRDAEAEETAAAEKVASLTVEKPIAGPRIKIEGLGFRSVSADDARSRTLLLDGNNYEHVSDVVDQDEIVWVYRRM